MLLKNKIAVITGNPYGIGRVSAALFAHEGARVVCIDDSRNGWTSSDAIAADAPDFIADVSDTKAVAAVVAKCESLLDRVDILFNLAGRTIKQHFEATTEETWNQMNTLVSRRLILRAGQKR